MATMTPNIMDFFLPTHYTKTRSEYPRNMVYSWWKASINTRSTLIIVIVYYLKWHSLFHKWVKSQPSTNSASVSVHLVATIVHQCNAVQWALHQCSTMGNIPSYVVLLAIASIIYYSCNAQLVYIALWCPVSKLPLDKISYHFIPLYLLQQQPNLMIILLVFRHTVLARVTSNKKNL